MRRQRQRIYVAFLLLLILTIGAGIVVVGQDLFGKVNPFILLPTYGIFLLSILIIIGSRLLTARHALNDIPKDYLPIQEYHVPKAMHKLIHDALAAALNVPMEPAPDKAIPAGWGAKGTPTARVHFKTFVAMSYQVVVKTIADVEPQLDRPANVSVRDYLRQSAEALDIDATLAEDYTNMYELARFGPDELTQADYSEFTVVFYNLIQSIKDARRPPVPRKSSWNVSL